MLRSCVREGFLLQLQGGGPAQGDVQGKLQVATGVLLQVLVLVEVHVQALV